MNQPILSIVTPVFNSRFLLKQLWENLVAQNYQNLDWVVVNDGSKDKETLQILDQIDLSCEFARVFHLENGGAPKARNYGYRQSKGSFVKFLDADDLLADNHLNRIQQHLDPSIKKQVLISPQRLLIDTGTEMRETALTQIDPDFFKKPFHTSLYQFDFHHSCCFFSRDLCQQLNWDESLFAYQDLDYLWNLFLLKPSFQLVEGTYFINREHSYTERITKNRSPQKWQSRVKAVSKISACIDWKNDNVLLHALSFRFNTLFVQSFFEDRNAAYVILREKEQVLKKKYDLDLMYRLLKYAIKHLIGR